MNHDYADIRSRIPEPAQWWDEHAVPRYCTFTPDAVADIYAQQVALCDIACQGCGARFHVAFSWSQHEWRKGEMVTTGDITPTEAARLHYGDPPNVGCCGAGATMNCDDLRVLEFWRKGGKEFTGPHPAHPEMTICLPGYFDWRRITENEVPMCDHPDYVEAP